MAFPPSSDAGTADDFPHDLTAMLRVLLWLRTAPWVKSSHRVLPSWWLQDTPVILIHGPLLIPEQASGTSLPAFKSQLCYL